jgi:hypothetical protein
MNRTIPNPQHRMDRPLAGSGLLGSIWEAVVATASPHSLVLVEDCLLQQAYRPATVLMPSCDLGVTSLLTVYFH